MKDNLTLQMLLLKANEGYGAAAKDFYLRLADIVEETGSVPPNAVLPLARLLREAPGDMNLLKAAIAIPSGKTGPTLRVDAHRDFRLAMAVAREKERAKAVKEKITNAIAFDRVSKVYNVSTSTVKAAWESKSSAAKAQLDEDQKFIWEQ